MRDATIVPQGTASATDGVDSQLKRTRPVQAVMLLDRFVQYHQRGV